MSELPFFQSCLLRELERRRRANRRYSIRAFAKALKISDGALSQILNGKRVPSLRTAERLMDALRVPLSSRDAFFTSLSDRQRSRGLLRLSPIFKPAEARKRLREVQLQQSKDVLQWYDIAILELTLLDSYRADPAWIGKQLNITTDEATNGLKRLLDLGLIRSSAGKWIKIDEKIAIKDTMSALQEQFLELSIQSVKNDPVETRCHTWMTLAVDPKKLPIARKMINDFIYLLSASLDDGKERRIYQLNVSLFPLQRPQ